MMEYRTLGRTGVRVSPFCLGTDNFANPTPEDEAKRLLNRALEAGINFIDTSNSYAQGESELWVALGPRMAGGIKLSWRPRFTFRLAPARMIGGTLACT